MGSEESSTRKVSFGVDEEDRVRILRGVKLTEDVLQRMKGVANIAPVHKTPVPPTSPPKASGAAPAPNPSRTSSPLGQNGPKPSRPQTSPKYTTPEASDTKEEENKRKSEQHHMLAQEELSKVARKEREAARMDLSKALSRERQHTQQESEKAKLLVLQLQRKDAELKALDAFYKEQVALLEKRNLERYGEANERFHHQATKSEAHIRARNTEPVCPGLQAQILSCYKDNREETLRCADLAREYMQCIAAAKKNLLVNHG